MIAKITGNNLFPASHGRHLREDAGASRFLAELEEQHRTEAKLLESYDLYQNLVDLREPYNDVNGETWSAIGAGVGNTNAGSPLDFAGFANEQELTQAREMCRRFFTDNEYAINGHRNRVNYIVGKGHKYTATPKKGIKNPNVENVKLVQEFVDEFLKANKWAKRQQETVLRADRDGEAFRRKFRRNDGMTMVRFVEPWQVANPAGANEATSFGIETDADDAETVIGYCVTSKAGQPPTQEDFVPADEIQHIKMNVDLNVRRGVPLFWPCRLNLRRCARSLRAIAARTELAAALCLNRKHVGGTAAAVEAFANAKATATRTNPFNGQTERGKSVNPGTITDSTANIEYEVLNIGFGLEEMVVGLQANLRAVATIAQMPEFMFTGDASNANYASTMVAEGPAVKSFEVMQGEFIPYDLELIDDAIAYAIEKGRLPAGILDEIEIQVEPPNVATREKDKEASTNETYCRVGIKSPQTVSAELGLDYEQEQQNIEEHRAKGRTIASDPQIDPNAVDADGNPLHPQAKKPGAAGDDKDKPGSAARRAAIKAQMEQATSPEEAIQIAIREAFV